MRVPANRASQPAPGMTVLALDKLRALHRKVREDNEKKTFSQETSFARRSTRHSLYVHVVASQIPSKEDGKICESVFV